MDPNLRKNLTLIGLSIFVLAFVVLMSVTVFSQVKATLESLHTLQTELTIHVLDIHEPFPETTILFFLLANYSMTAQWARNYLFNSCSCVKQKNAEIVGKRTYFYENDIQKCDITFNSHRNWSGLMRSNFSLMIKNAQMWGHMEEIVLTCNHDVDDAFFLSIMIMPDTYDKSKKMAADMLSMDSEEIENHAQEFYKQIQGISPQWVPLRTSNQVHSYLEQVKEMNKPTRTSVFSMVSSTGTGRENETVVSFRWGRGEYKKYTLHTSGTHWSLITLAATVFLAAERLFAFIQRTRRVAKKSKRPKLDKRRDTGFSLENGTNVEKSEVKLELTQNGTEKHRERKYSV